MAGVDVKLADSLKHAKTNPTFFVFVAKGNEGKLLVDKKKVSPKDADAAKKAFGGGTIYKGRCQGEEAKMVFHVGIEVPLTLAALTKKIIKQDAGLMLDVEYRFAADLAAEESQTETPGEASNPTAAAPPPLATPPAAPPAPQPPALQTAHAGAEVLKRLNAMSANIKVALAGSNKPSVQTLFVSVNSLIKHSDFVQAGKVLDELEPLLAPSSSPPPSSQPQPDHGGAEVIHRLNGISANIKAALAGPNKARVQTLFVSVNGLIKNHDFVQAGAALDELEPLVANSNGVPASAKETGPELTAALQKWTTARAAVVEQIKKVIAEFKASKDPEADEGVILMDAIVKNLTPRPVTRQQVDELVAYLEKDDIIVAAESPNPYGFTVSIRAPLLNVLAELKKYVA